MRELYYAHFYDRRGQLITTSQNMALSMAQAMQFAMYDYEREGYANEVLYRVELRRAV